MPTTKKSAGGRGSESGSARTRAGAGNDPISRLTKSLEAAQKELATLGGSLGSGALDLRKDVAKRLRDATRDLTKMS